jgi:outer membrane usher protein
VQARDGSASLYALLQKALPVGPGFGYRAEATVGGINRFDGRLSLQTDFGTYDAELTWVDGQSGARVTARGAIAIAGGTIFASRELDQSFAMVRVGNYAGVRVYADNQLVGTTDASGVAVVPRLRPFDRNDIRIELADLPMDAEVSSPQQTVRPYARSGVTVDFRAKRARAALARIVLADGSTPPAGASVRLDGRTDEFVIAPGGQVYFTELGDSNAGEASWNGGSCRFGFRMPQTNDAQPDLGDLKCAAARP